MLERHDFVYNMAKINTLIRGAAMFSRDESLKKTYVLLTLFINRDKDSLSLTQPLLSVLNYLDVGTPEDIAALRGEIKSWINNNPQTAARTIDNMSLHDALHSFLIAMAAAKPINTEDPITQDAVAESKRIVTSDGYQFDAESLLTWIKTKGKMVNPLTNLIFAEKDQLGIIVYAAENKIDITHTYSGPEQEDPGLLRSALDAMNTDQRPSLFGEDPEHIVERFYWPTRQGSIYRPQVSHTDILGSGRRLSTTRRLGINPPTSHFLFESGEYRDNTTTTRIGNNIGINFNPSFFGSSPRNDAIDRLGISNNTWMQRTVTALTQYGLTIDYLMRHWQGRDGVFSDGVFDEFVSNLLIYLVTGSDQSRNEDKLPSLTAEQRLSPAQAINEINGLTYNEFRALSSNYAYGLRKNHLLSWRSSSNSIYFGQGHGDALTLMLGEQHLSPEEAIQRISGLTESQAWDLYREIRRASNLSQPSLRPS